MRLHRRDPGRERCYGLVSPFPISVTRGGQRVPQRSEAPHLSGQAPEPRCRAGSAQKNRDGAEPAGSPCSAQTHATLPGPSCAQEAPQTQVPRLPEQASAGGKNRTSCSALTCDDDLVPVQQECPGLPLPQLYGLRPLPGQLQQAAEAFWLL